MPSLALQKAIFCLPQKLRRIRVAQWLGLNVMGTARHQLIFREGRLVGDIRDGAVALALVKKTFEDYGYFNLARNLLAAGGVHLDVGANFGFHTFGLLSTPALRGLEYVMVETNPECCACLNFSRALHPEVHCQLIPNAVGSADGRLRLSFDAGAMGSGYVSDATGANPASGAVSVVEVPCRRLDDILPEAGVHHVRLMKMDIEGSETDALRGARRHLQEGRIDYIYFEINGIALARRGSTIPELLDVLRSADFQLFWPHHDLDWLRTVCGREFKPSEEKFAQLPGPDGLRATLFDPTRHKLKDDSQLDLLAVHGSQPLEIVPGA